MPGTADRRRTSLFVNATLWPSVVRCVTGCASSVAFAAAEAGGPARGNRAGVPRMRNGDVKCAAADRMPLIVVLVGRVRAFDACGYADEARTGVRLARRGVKGEGATHKQKALLGRAGLSGVEQPDNYLLSHGNPHYHRRGVVSRSCSGWEGVGPTRYGHQA